MVDVRFVGNSGLENATENKFKEKLEFYKFFFSKQEFSCDI